MGEKVVVSTVCLNQWAMDFEGNFFRILEGVKQAKKQGSRIVLFPELAIPGYGCGDHFHESDTFLHSWEVLAEIMQHPDCKNILTVVGMPIMHKSVAYNCQVAFLDCKIILIRPKQSMCDDFNYRETRWFSPWVKKRLVEDFYLPQNIKEITNQKIVPIGDALLSTNDTCIGFEICEELFISESTQGRQSLDGAEIFCNSSGSHHELNKIDLLSRLIQVSNRTNGGVYLYSNLRGGDGERLYYNGSSSICFNGEFLAKAQQFSLQEVEVVSAIVDLEEVRTFRNSRRSRGLSAGRNDQHPRVSINFQLAPSYAIQVPVSTPINVHAFKPEEEISLGPACWLWDYLRRSGQGGFFLPLSGGVDSSSTACIVFSMCNLICQAVKHGASTVLDDVRCTVGDHDYFPEDPKELCNRLFITCYLGTENSSAKTKSRAVNLGQQIGSYHMSVGIDFAVTAVLGVFTAITTFVPKFKVNGGSVRENLALQNVQARLRMVISYLFAQLMLWVRGRPGGLLVLGSTNVDESLRGYLTKYDCSSADINPIGGISKTDLKKFLNFMRVKYKLSSLESILAAPPTAELEPLSKNGALCQTDESDMGMTYDELSLYGKLRKQKFCGPYSMFCKLLDVWGTKHSPEEIANKVKFFFRFYAINRHKMTVLTPSYHAETYSPDDNRYDHRQFLYNIKWTWQFQAIDDKLKQLKMAKELKLDEASGTSKQVNSQPSNQSLKNELSSVNYNSKNNQEVSDYFSKTGKVLFADNYDEDDADSDYKMWEQIRKKYSSGSSNDVTKSVSEFV